MLDTLYKSLERNALVISIIIFSLFYFVFFPKAVVTIDEQNYFTNSVNILNGTLRQDCALNIEGQFDTGDYCIFKYNIGTSLLLIPGAILGSTTVAFIISYIFTIIGIFTFSKILRLLELSQIFLFLYSFFPSLLFYSRTLMSETFSISIFVFLLCAGIKYLQDRRSILPLSVGFASGLIVSVRYTNAIILLVWWVLFTLIEVRRGSKFDMVHWTKYVTIGILPWILGLSLFNTYLYGSPLRSGYFFSGEEGISFENITIIVPYILILSLLYPGMLFLGWKMKSDMKYWLLIPPYIAVLFYSLVPIELFDGNIADIIIGMRFLVPIIPFLLIAYVKILDKWKTNRMFEGIMLFIVIALILTGGMISAIHYLKF